MALLFAPPFFRATDIAGDPIPGAFLAFYATGTSTLQAIWSEPGLTIPLTNPIQSDGNGWFPAIWLDDSLPAYKFVLSAPDVNNPTIPGAVLRTGDPYNATFDAAGLAALLNAQTPQEALAGVIPVDLTYRFGEGPRYGMKDDSGVTDNTIPMTNALKATAGSVPLTIPFTAGYYKMSGRVVAPANTHIILHNGAELRWTSTAATGTSWLGSSSRPGIEVTGDNFVLEGQGKITGPASGVYVVNEFGIMRVGPGSGNQGTAAPGNGFKVTGIEISNWGSGGIVHQFVNNTDISKNKIHDCGYEGVHLLSPRTGTISQNEVYNIIPGTGSNAYGISCTHDSTNYSSDPAVAGTGAYVTGAIQRQAVNPFPVDMRVVGNTVRDVPLWLGIDFHGAFDSVVDGNKVYNCFRGIQLSSSSGSAAAFSGENNKVINNTVYASQQNGAATTVANGGAAGTGSQSGITVNGGAATAAGYHRRVHVTGNTLIGVGNKPGGTTFSIECSFMNDAVIANNIIQGCYGDAIIGSNFDGHITGNRFGGAGQTASSRAIHLQGSNGHVVIGNNSHDAHGGNVYATGIDMSSSSATRITLSGNDFQSATTPVTATVAQFTQGNSEVTPRISDTTTGSHTVDVSVAGQAPVVYVELSAAGSATLTSLLNPARVGQKVIVANIANTTCTINDTGNIRLSGGTAAVVQFSTIEFVCQSLVTPCWYETCRSLSNT